MYYRGLIDFGSHCLLLPVICSCLLYSPSFACFIYPSLHSLCFLLIPLVNCLGKNKYYLTSSWESWSYLSTSTMGPAHEPSPQKGEVKPATKTNMHTQAPPKTWLACTLPNLNNWLAKISQGKLSSHRKLPQIWRVLQSHWGLPFGYVYMYPTTTSSSLLIQVAMFSKYICRFLLNINFVLFTGLFFSFGHDCSSSFISEFTTF